MTIRSALVLSLAGVAALAPGASALPSPKHVPAPHVCVDGSAPQRGGVGEDGHSNQTGQGHTVHGNGFGYGHGCGDDVDTGGGTGGGSGGGPTDT